MLVANTKRGWITEVNGITRRHVRRITGLGHPVALAFVPGAEGLVRPRYAVVADAHGWVDLFDLRRGGIARRAKVARPIAIAVANGELWIASARQTRISQFDLSAPPRLELVAHPQTGMQLIALAIDSIQAAGVDGITSAGGIIHIDAITLAVTKLGRIPDRATQLLAGYNGELWAAASSGKPRSQGRHRHEDRDARHAHRGR